MLPSAASQAPQNNALKPSIRPHRSYQWEGLDPPDEVRAQYAEIARALAPHVDVLLAETLSTVEEAQAAAEASAGLGTWSRCS